VVASASSGSSSGIRTLIDVRAFGRAKHRLGSGEGGSLLDEVVARFHEKVGAILR
jgi:hypothetical protein